jgi:hypothetical protein
MTSCTYNTPAHDDRDILPVRLGLGRDVRLACAGCREHISASTYLRVVERREASVPVARDRRRFVPAGLRNLTGRDETGAVLR